MTLYSSKNKTLSLAEFEGLLFDSCENGKLETVIHLLTSLKVNQHTNESAINQGFIVACQFGHLEIAKYLLTSNNIKEQADIHFLDDKGFRLACEKGHLEIVKYLLTDNKLTEHSNIHARNDYGFNEACLNEHMNVLKFLIFDMNIEMTDNIQKHLTKNPNEEIENLFKIREENQLLEKHLSTDNVSHRKVKL